MLLILLLAVIASSSSLYCLYFRGRYGERILGLQLYVPLRVRWQRELRSRSRSAHITPDDSTLMLGDGYDNSPAEEGEGLSKEVVDGVKKFIFFIGWARSGHSIVGSLLNAHPNMVVSYEYNVFNKIQSSNTKSSLFDAIYQRSIPVNGTDMTSYKKGYTLFVDNSWQGKFHQLEVIGDKSGDVSALTTPEEYKSRYKTLSEVVGIPILMLCVIRNPFDVISTTLFYENIRVKWKNMVATGEVSETKKKVFYAKSVNATIEKFFYIADAVTEHCVKNSSQCLIVHSVDLVRDTRGTMKQLCTFLEVGCYEFYLQQCQEKVFSELSKSRKLVNWSQEQINEVERKMKDYHFFDRYSFHSDE